MLATSYANKKARGFHNYDLQCKLCSDGCSTKIARC